MAKGKLKDIHKTIVIGGSAGSLSALLRIIPLLKRDMNISVLIVMHRMASSEEVLLDVLEARTSFEVKEVDDKDELCRGIIYIAPADYHVLVESNRLMTLDDSEKVNFSRPSIDVTFESAADACGPSLVGVLLSGANSDGALGLKRIKEKGGKIVVQDPSTADFPFMPGKALEYVEPDLLLTEANIAKMADLI